MKRILPSILFVILVVAESCKKDEATTNLIYQNDFTTDNNTWFKSCDPDYCFKYDDGKYDDQILVANYIAWAYAPCGLLNSTFSMSVDCSVQLDDQTKFGSAGFVYNYIDDTNYKVFLVSNNGYYQIREKSGSSFTNLVDWTASSAIQIRGIVNTLKLQQSASSIEFFVNGSSLGVFPYSQAFNFKVGLAAQSASVSTDFATLTAVFDNLVIQKFP